MPPSKKSSPAKKTAASSRKSTTRKKAASNKSASRRRNTSPTRSARDKGPRRKCFVISPFGGWFDEYYVTVFTPAIEKADLESHRADNIYRPSPIIQDIWEEINQADILLADLTGRNPNVMYELGLAHALRKPVVMVTQNIGDVPFDVQGVRVISYDVASPSWAETLGDLIVNAINEALESPSTATLQPFTSRRTDDDQDSEGKILASIRSIERRLNRVEAQQTASPPTFSYTPPQYTNLVLSNNPPTFGRVVTTNYEGLTPTFTTLGPQRVLGLGKRAPSSTPVESSTAKDDDSDVEREQ